MPDDSGSGKIEIDLNQVAPEVLTLLDDEKTATLIFGVTTECNLHGWQISKVSRSVLYLFANKISLAEYPSFLAKELGVGNAQAARVACLLGKTLFSRRPDLLPGIETAYKNWLTLVGSKSLEKSDQLEKAPSALTPNKLVPQRPVPTTSDIRRPVKRPVPPPVPAPVAPKKVIPPATPVKPASSVASKPPLDQFQLRTVDDLINVPAATLQKEPDDEKKLVGRFKQEIQDIANYSGAKRTDIVAGWKKSQIYHTYIEMGNDSIQQGKPIDDIKSLRQMSGKPYLTENQFHAVSEISRLLLR